MFYFLKPKFYSFGPNVLEDDTTLSVNIDYKHLLHNKSYLRK